MFDWPAYQSLGDRILNGVEFAVPVGYHLKLKIIYQKINICPVCPYSDEHVPGKEGADTKPVEDDVDKPEFVLWTILQIFGLASHSLSVMRLNLSTL